MLQLLLLLGCAASRCRAARQPKGGTISAPNIAVIVADDLGTFDLSCMGHPSIRTPHIDGMARDGVIFTQWLSAAPICTPSRSSLYSGRLPIRTGLYADAVAPPLGKPPNASHFGIDAWQRKDGAGGLPLTEVTLPELLGQHGYTSVMHRNFRRAAAATAAQRRRRSAARRSRSEVRYNDIDREFCSH
eukprot:SAG31_NODE_4548_length_3149_cov_1.504918_1_plen_188_part_00